jgi:hypothetical protein
MDPTGFAAIVMVFSVPLAFIHAWYRVRKLRTEEHLAAIAKGVACLPPKNYRLTRGRAVPRFCSLLAG